MNRKPIAEVESELIVDCWNGIIGEQFPMRKELWIQNTLMDPNILSEGSVAVFEEGDLVGFVVSKVYQEELPAVMPKETGWIQCLLVREEFRNRGIGSELLRIAEEAISNLNSRELMIGRDPQHYVPGIPLSEEASIRFFERRGYEKETIETDLICHVKDMDVVSLHNHETYYRVLNKDDQAELISFLSTAFPGRWHYEALKYFELGGQGREFIGLFIDGTMKGFCRINDPSSPTIAQNVYWSPLFNGATGGIGPLGIERSVRGNQLGLDLVKAASNELIKRGMEHMIIDWTQLTEFYGKLGFTPWKQYQTMSKRLYSK